MTENTFHRSIKKYQMEEQKNVCRDDMIFMQIYNVRWMRRWIVCDRARVKIIDGSVEGN